MPSGSCYRAAGLTETCARAGSRRSVSTGSNSIRGSRCSLGRRCTTGRATLSIGFEGSQCGTGRPKRRSRPKINTRFGSRPNTVGWTRRHRSWRHPLSFKSIPKRRPKRRFLRRNTISTGIRKGGVRQGNTGRCTSILRRGRANTRRRRCHPHLRAVVGEARILQVRARSGSRSRRPVLLPAPVQCRRSRPRPTRCSNRPKPTESRPPPSDVTTPDHEWPPWQQQIWT
jgi:hypothetical protein